MTKTEAVAAKNLTAGSRILVGNVWYDVTEAPSVTGEMVTVWLAPISCPAEESRQTFEADAAITVLVPLTSQQVYWLGKAS